MPTTPAKRVSGAAMTAEEEALLAQSAEMAEFAEDEEVEQKVGHQQSILYAENPDDKNNDPFMTF